MEIIDLANFFSYTNSFFDDMVANKFLFTMKVAIFSAENVYNNTDTHCATIAI